jgi:hypothetical protein
LESGEDSVMAKHVHKYRRMKVGKLKDYPIFRCFVPGCTHYVSEDLIINRECICWACDKPFVINLKLIRMKPICQECKDKRKGDRPRLIEDFNLEDMLANIAAKAEEE